MKEMEKEEGKEKEREEEEDKNNNIIAQLKQATSLRLKGKKEKGLKLAETMRFFFVHKPSKDFFP